MGTKGRGHIRLAGSILAGTLVVSVTACFPPGPVSTSNGVDPESPAALVLKPIFSLTRAGQHYYTTDRSTAQGSGWIVDYTVGEQDNADKCPVDPSTGRLNNVPAGPLRVLGDLPDPAGCAQGIAGYLWVDPKNPNPAYNPNIHPWTKETELQPNGTFADVTYTLQPLFDLTNSTGQHRYTTVPQYTDPGTFNRFGSSSCASNCKVLGYGYDPSNMPVEARRWTGYRKPGFFGSDAYYAADTTGATWAASNGYTRNLGAVIGLRAQNPVLEAIVGLENRNTGQHVYSTKKVEQSSYLSIPNSPWSIDKSEGAGGGAGQGNGVIGYAWNEQAPGTVPIYWLHDSRTGDSLYTTSTQYVRNLGADWSMAGVLGYVSNIPGPELAPLNAYSKRPIPPAFLPSDEYLTTGTFPNPGSPPSGYTRVDPNTGNFAPNPTPPAAYVFTNPDAPIPYYEVSTNGPAKPTNWTGPRPIMVVVHGGGWNGGWETWAGDPMWWAQEPEWEREVQFWNSQGWTTYNVEYHTYVDMSTAALRRFVGELRSITQAPVCVTGGSAGGQLALMAVSQGTGTAGDVTGPQADCALALAGPTDLTALGTPPQIFPTVLSPAAGSGSSAAALAPYAPKTNAANLNVPVFVAGSTHDGTVAIGQILHDTPNDFVNNWLAGHSSAPRRITNGTQAMPCTSATQTPNSLPAQARGPELDVYCLQSVQAGQSESTASCIQSQSDGPCFVHDHVVAGSATDQAGPTQGAISYGAFRNAEKAFASRVLAGWATTHPSS